MNLEELKKVVEKATPGPWDQKIMRDASVNVFFADQFICEVGNEDTAFGEQIKADAKHIATFNPSLVSKLLRVVEALEQICDDFGEDGHCCCPAAKDQAIAALRDLEQS